MTPLRDQFPVLRHKAYLNAGTAGPVPERALAGVEESLQLQATEGRGGGRMFGRLREREAELRSRVAALTRAAPEELTVTGATTDGINAALLALDLRRGDEVLTSDEEHPALLAPLSVLRSARGIRVRTAPFGELPGEVRPDTRLVACSHVSWATGRVMDVEALSGQDATVLLDGAQSLGAVPLDLPALGCDLFAASGQKWLCGPNGSGYLYARAEMCPDLVPPWPGYHVLEDPTHALESELFADARRLGTGFAAPHQVEFALGALDVLEEAGLDEVQRRAAELASVLAQRLAERGTEVSPRGASTLVSFRVTDPDDFVERSAANGVVIRTVPASSFVRASVGGWSTEEDLERLLAVPAG